MESQTSHDIYTGLIQYTLNMQTVSYKCTYTVYMQTKKINNKNKHHKHL